MNLSLLVYNWIEVKTKMWGMNLGKPIAVPQLNEAMATELGANLLGEAIIFIIGAALLIVEYRKSKAEKDKLTTTLADMASQLERQENEIKFLTTKVEDLGIRKPFFNKSQ